MARYNKLLAALAAAVSLAKLVAAIPTPQDADVPNDTGPPMSVVAMDTKDTTSTASALEASVTETAAEPEPTGDFMSIFVDELIANLTEAAETNENEKRSLTCSVSLSRTVNLLYAKYQGYQDSSSGLNVWKGYVFRSISSTLSLSQPDRCRVSVLC